jgi:hypothetical protein
LSKEENQIYGVVLPIALATRARIVAAILGVSRSKLMRILLINYLNYFDAHVDQDVYSPNSLINQPHKSTDSQSQGKEECDAE